MDISLEDFHQDFMQHIISDAESRGILRSQAFYENVCEELISSGELTINYTVAEYIKNNMEVCGYDYDEERQILTLLCHKFFQEAELQTLKKTDITSNFKKLKTYLTSCNNPQFYKSLEETDPAYSMSLLITQYLIEEKISKFRLVLITDGKTTRNLTQIDSEKIFDVDLDYRVIDINHIYRLFLLEQTGGSFEAEVNLPCLKVVDNEKYQSYLAVIKGLDLINIYERFGQKLFEQNVRTFLQFKGGVNKGLKNTIQYSPEMFFAYNNGITATATEVEFSESGNISKIINLQIVNGGQTTSAIYAAYKTSKLDVSAIAVQIKLSVVIDPKQTYDFVSKVSEYANTQNKINPSDFFSNSPFHKEFKNYSERVRVPVVGGAQIQTHWFYERVRGQYLNEQAYLTPAKKHQFSLENPKGQLLEKTLLAKSEVAWLQKPDTVSKGAQDSTRIFAAQITDMLEKSSLAITENYFKNAVAKIILFKYIERLISKAEWYNQAYRAQTVAYTMSHLSYMVRKTGKSFDFNKIWVNQSVPKELGEILNVTGREIYKYITTPKEGYGNPSQWCKREKCWDEVKALYFEIKIPDSLLVDNEEKIYETKSDRKEKELDNGIEIQTFVITQKQILWKELNEYFSNDENISIMQKDILNKYAQGILKLPSEKQSKILYDLYTLAKKEGFISNQ